MTNRTVLLVEDSPGDVRLTQEAFREADSTMRLCVVVDGVEAIALLRREGVFASAPRPDRILLDLSLLKMDGRQVLASIKGDDNLKTIPTTSDAEEDIETVYSFMTVTWRLSDNELWSIKFNSFGGVPD
jgi:CheY-like chemotaxis protein